MATPRWPSAGAAQEAFTGSDREELDITEACIEARPPGSRVAIWPGPINTVYTGQDRLAVFRRRASRYHLSGVLGA
ncbi:MAG: hypothetical protein OXF41_10125 [bacterium]|nr:hypothetical protein [bacterium]